MSTIWYSISHQMVNKYIFEHKHNKLDSNMIGKCNRTLSFTKYPKNTYKYLSITHEACVSTRYFQIFPIVSLFIKTQSVLLFNHVYLFSSKKLQDSNLDSLNSFQPSPNHHCNVEKSFYFALLVSAYL